VNRIIVALLALVLLGGVLFFGLQAKQSATLRRQASQNAPDPKKMELATVRLKVGGEKVGCLKDPAVQKILLDDYHLQLNPEREGSVEMVQEPTSGYDAIWPASEFCKQLFEERARASGVTGYKTADVFSSPLVVMSWPLITNALQRRGIVTARDGTLYIADMQRLLKVIEDRTRWRDLDSSLAVIYGSVCVRSTDPTRSNSGSMFMGLLANLMNGGEPCPADQIEKLLPRIKTISNRMGLKETSSGDIFQHFMSQGVGAYPMMVVYENQFLEALALGQGTLRAQVHILYPEPTVWATHPFIALNANGRRLLDALQDPRLQKIMWEGHGFRSATPGAMNDPQVFKVRGVPQQIVSAMPTPEWEVMQRITQELTTDRP
jgi:hypothetical protein